MVLFFLFLLKILDGLNAVRCIHVDSVVGLDEDLSHETEDDHQKADNNEENCQKWWEDVVGHLSARKEKTN